MGDFSYTASTSTAQTILPCAFSHWPYVPWLLNNLFLLTSFLFTACQLSVQCFITGLITVLCPFSVFNERISFIEFLDAAS